jgi:hypothetical protein
MFRCILFILLILVPSRAESPIVSASRKNSEVAVTFGGDAETEQILEFTSALGQPWKPLIGVNMTGSPVVWTNPIAGGAGFFRTTQNAEPTYAENFRLVDHNGKSRELYYYAYDTNLVAVVLTFAQSNYTTFSTKIAKLKTTTAYKNKVLFWTIDADPANSRTNIARVASTSTIDWPIFHDPLQLVARDFDANFNGETFVVSSEDMKIAYRGVIEDSTGRNYVAESLDKLLAAAPVTVTRLEPKDSPISHIERPIADYSTVIAPLLQRKCVVCHSPGNIAPFAMTNYNGLIEHTPHMKEAILTKMMPPWHADPLYGKFSGDFSLSEIETTQIVDWIDAGIPRGAGPDPLADIPPKEPTKWPAELGEPDQIVTIPTQNVPATGTVAYRYIYANATNSTAKWLRAAVVRPSNRSVVHHYIVWPGKTSFAQLTGIATYVPGHIDRPFPDGTGIQLAANAPLTFNIHYTANGTATTDKPELGLYYASTPPARTLKYAAPLNFFFSIPPNNSEYEVTSSQTFSSAATLFSFSPHMHVRGLRMRFELVPPAPGVRRILASIPKYDFMWQTIYTLETPLEIAAGSRIEVIGAYDNSPMNLFNPNPNLSVGWGEQSWEEMFIGYMEYADR